MKKIIKWLDVNFEAVLMVFFFALMISLVTIQVILRFFLKNGFSWAEEVAKLLFVWMAFASFGYLTRNGRHVRVSFLTGKLPEKLQKMILVICDILFLLFAAVGFHSSVNLCMNAIRFQDKLVSVPWNYSALYFAGVLGFFMMVLRNIQVLIWRGCNWKASMERFVNYDGVYFANHRICFAPREKDALEQMEAAAEEKLEVGD